MKGRRVAFLRGINVGGHRVKMDALRRIFEEMGFEGVVTFIASGNVVFDDDGTEAQALERRIEAGLHEALGYEVATFTRWLAEVAELVGGEVVSPDELEGVDHAHYVLLLDAPPTDAVIETFRALDSERDSFRVRGREVHWLSRGRISESPLFGRVFEGATREIRHTSRNANTLRKLVAKFSSE